MLFLVRWGFAFLLIAATFNPSPWNFVVWVRQYSAQELPLTVLFSLVLVISYLIYLRATFLSIGWLGVCLGAALFGCIVWLFVDLKWLSLDSTSLMGYLALLLLSLMIVIKIIRVN